MNFNQDDIFAVYRLPHSKKRVTVIQNSKNTYSFDKNSLVKSGFVLYPFSKDKHKPIFIKADKIYMNRPFVFSTNSIGHSVDITVNEYLDKIRFFVREIKNGYRKIVLSRNKSITKDKVDLFALFKELESHYPNAMIFLVNHPEAGTWMGATPEILIEKNGNTIKTMALAGTQLISDPGSAVWKSKELDEQKAVMEFIESVFDKNDVLFKSKGPYTKTAAKIDNHYLIHLATDYYIRQVNNLYDMILDLHPTPAVSGMPKEKAINYILQNESYDRRYYTGFLGPVNIKNKNRMNLFVNLRSMEIFKNIFLLYAGGGLTKDSIAEKEWEETENKAKTLSQIIKKSSSCKET